MKRTLLAGLILLSAMVASCYPEPEESPCFTDGEINGLEPTRSNQCCTQVDDPNEDECRTFYGDPERGFENLKDLARCGDDGVCELECVAGQNCACLWDGACETDVGVMTCQIKNRSEGFCEDQGQHGEQPSCSVCLPPD